MNKAQKMYVNTHLKKVPLFSNLTDRQLGMLYTAGIIKQFAKGCTIVKQNDPGNTFYIVISGRAKVTLIHEDGKEIVLSIFKKGDFFGELSLLDNEPRSANVIIMEDAVLFLLTRVQFHQLIISRPEILGKVLKEICSRLRNTNEKLGSLAFLDVYGRTIQILQQLAHERGLKTKNGIEILQAPTHQELSSMVGASREAITRIIRLLRENKNLVSYQRRKVVLREYPSKPLL